ncbi:MAG: hypothetical protein IJ553_02635 [Alloprevotella sp.]|nr:hypothetical protein [Alloprevotella sp.]
MHRFYGVANIDGVDYRVMTLMKEENKAKRGNGIHSYEVQKIEVLDEETPNTSNGVGTLNSELEGYPLAKVIKDAETAIASDGKIRKQKVSPVFYSNAERDGVRYTILTEKKGDKETFWDFYTNKKTSQPARKTHSEEARDIDKSDVSGAMLQKVSGKDKESEKKNDDATVTDAFKDRFGGREDDPDEASKVVNEDGQPQYDKVSPERTHKFIFEELGFDEEEASGIVAENVKEKQKALDALMKRQPKPIADVMKFKQQKDAWQAKVEQAQKELDYWKQVDDVQKQREAGRMQEEEETAPVENATEENGFVPSERNNELRKTADEHAERLEALKEQSEELRDEIAQLTEQRKKARGNRRKEIEAKLEDLKSQLRELNKQIDEADELAYDANNAWNDVNSEELMEHFRGMDTEELERMAEKKKASARNDEELYGDDEYNAIIDVLSERDTTDKKEYANEYEKDNAEGTVDTEGGLKQNELSEELLSEGWRNILHLLGRRVGRRIEVVSGEELKRLTGQGNANGAYDPNTNTIYLNADRVHDEEGLQRFVAGHEMTHAIKTDNDPRVWDAFVETVKEAMGEDFANEFASLRDRYDRAYEQANKERAQRGLPPYRTLTDAEVEEEVCANWAGRHMLTDQEAVRRIVDKAEAAGADPVSLTQKILKWINETLATLRNMLKGGSDVTAQVRAMEQAKALWQQMYDVSVAKRNAMKEVGTSIDGVGKDARLSLSSIVEGAGFETKVVDKDGTERVLTDEEGNVAFRLGEKEFSAKHPIAVRDIKGNKDCALNYLVEDALHFKTVSQHQAEKIYQQYATVLNAFLKMGAKDVGGATAMTDAWQYVADTVYRTVAPNSDDQYIKSLDITRVCKKNEAVIKAISELQVRQGYGVTPGQILDLYYNTIDKGYQVPCPVCYVFSRYVRNGRYATAAVNGFKVYGDHLPSGKDPWTVEQWQAEEERLRSQNKDFEKELKAADELCVSFGTRMDEKMDELRNAKTDEEKDRIKAEMAQLDNDYRKANQVWQAKALSVWIKSFVLESRRGRVQLRKDARTPEDMEDFLAHAMDLRRTSETMRVYPGIQRMRKAAGSAGGKEITFVSNNNLGEVVSGLGVANPGAQYANWYQTAANATTDKERATARRMAMKSFENAMKYIAAQNLRGGVRMWSWSDNLERLSPDVAVNLMQVELLGGGMQTYSKQLEGIELVGSMGAYVNGSLMAKDNGYRVVGKDQVEERDGRLVLKTAITEDIEEHLPRKRGGGVRKVTRVLADEGSPIYEEDGKMYVGIFDDVIGIDPHGREEDGKKKIGLFGLNKLYDRVGNIIVGLNDLHIRTMLNDSRIFFVIPWHASGAVNHILKETMRFLGQGDVKSTDYTKMQEEHRYGNQDPIEEKVRAFYERWYSRQGKKYACGLEGGVDSSQPTLSASQQHYRDLRRLIFDDAFSKPFDKFAKDYPEAIAWVAESHPELTGEEIRSYLLDEIRNDEFLGQTYREVQDAGVKMTGNDNKYIYPYEYWDTASTFETAGVNNGRYIEYCRRMGVRPKFSGVWGGEEGHRSTGDFTDCEGYWKLLIDRRMYDRDGRYQRMTPIDSGGFREEMIDPAKTRDRFHPTEVADDPGIDEIVDATMEQESKRLVGGDVQYEYGKDVEQSVQGEAAMPEEQQVKFSLVEDEAEIDRLDKEEHEKAFRTVILKDDGGFASPMGTRLKNKGKAARATAPFELGKWEKSDENLDLVDENGKIDIVKETGGSLKVDYNPYIHLRPDAVNMQFDEAWNRPNLVYIETAYPTSELTSGYHAEKAKKSVGRTPWTGGDLILSRWDKPLRIVPWEEVADQWAQSDAVQKKIKRYGGIPFKKVSPQMRDPLVERGVKILPPTAKDGKACRQAYEEWMASSDQTRFSLTDEMREIETKAKEGKYLGKAPNGEKSDLETRKQWLEVRTKNFKDFFGDWEASALYKMAQEAISTKQHAGTYRFTPEEKLKKKLENLTGHPINGVIIESSRIIHVDKHHGEGEDQRGQIDITAEDIALLPYYLNNYDAIIPNPQYDTNEGRAYTVYKRINGVVVVGTIEIGKTGMAVATEFKKKVADVQMYNAPELNALDASAIAKVKKEILKLKENFENSSKVVDENGEPLVVYNANAVDADTIGEEVQVPINRFDRDIAHDGFWFTADKEFARRWVEEWMEYDNDRVRACYLNMRNPLVIDAKGADWKDVDGRSTDDWARYAEENGYDGLIVRNVLEGTDSEYTTKLTDSYAVFRPEQIKSATDNNGGFDATNPDIRFSLEDEVAEHKKGEKPFEPTKNEKKVLKVMEDHLNAMGIEATFDHKVGQRVLDAANGRGVHLMGTRVERRKAQIAAELQGRELTAEQQAVVDVFTGSKDNQPLTITDKDGKERRIVMRQGNEHGAGTKHSIFGHYGTSSNQYKAEEILFIPDIIKNGERKQKGGKVAYEIVRDGVTYTVTTEQSKSGLERFTNFYTNRKPTTVLNDTSNTDEQHASQQSVSSAKLQKVPEKDAAETEKIFNAAKKTLRHDARPARGRLYPA